MAQDLYGRLPLEFGGAFSADAAVVTFGGIAGGGVGLLTQQLNFQYAQQITKLYEVGTRKVYLVHGRSQGSSSASRILGPRPVALAFYQVYGNACNAATNTLLFQVASGCNLPGDSLNTVTLAMTGTHLSAVAMSVTSDNMIINEQISMGFISLLV